MKKKAKGGRTSIDCNAGDEAIDDLERRRVCYQEEDECRVQRVFHFQTKGETHLRRMWVIFRDPKTAFNHPDKYVFEMVADNDILKYQKGMGEIIGGRAHDFLQDVYFLQPFFTSKDDVEYYVRRYIPWATRKESVGGKQ